MLVLSRKPGESIRIGDDIEITITEVRGGRVKIGISAPRDCTIRRGELDDWSKDRETASRETVASATAAQAGSVRRQRGIGLKTKSQPKTSHNRIRLAMETTPNPFILD